MYEFKIYIQEKEINIFVQKGFFIHDIPTTTLHRHHYTEIHLIESGSLEYLVDNQKIPVKKEEMILIPPNVFHKCYPPKTSATVISFQIDIPFPACQILSTVPGIVTNFKKEIDADFPLGIAGKIPAFLTLICGDLLSLKTQKLKPIQDRYFIIYEFFQQKYDQEVTISDLARELNLSNKQTERLVKAYTGNTFRKELIKRKLQAAKHLLETEDITLSLAANQVGYHSYSGFWKAFTQKR